MKMVETAQVESSYVNQLTCGLMKLQQQQILCDVTLSADDGKLFAHSAVLAAASKFVCGQFQQLRRSV